MRGPAIYTITVVYNAFLSAPNKRALERAITTHGLNHGSNYHQARRAASAISMCAGAKRVLLTRVEESHEGTWCKGLKQ